MKATKLNYKLNLLSKIILIFYLILYTPLMEKSIISVVGKDKVGIIAKICTYLAKNNVNILDISQTIVGGLFQMMMICDTDKCTKEFHAVSTELQSIGNEMGIQIKLQKEEIFEKMQRI